MKKFRKSKAEKVLSNNELLRFDEGSVSISCPSTPSNYSMCKEAVLHDCEIVGGYAPGTHGFHACVGSGYEGRSPIAYPLLKSIAIF